jgi:hypothetical protein
MIDQKSAKQVAFLISIMVLLPRTILLYELVNSKGSPTLDRKEVLSNGIGFGNSTLKPVGLGIYSCQ